MWANRSIVLVVPGVLKLILDKTKDSRLIRWEVCRGRPNWQSWGIQSDPNRNFEIPHVHIYNKKPNKPSLYPLQPCHMASIMWLLHHGGVCKNRSWEGHINVLTNWTERPLHPPRHENLWKYRDDFEWIRATDRELDTCKSSRKINSHPNRRIHYSTCWI